MPVLLGVVERRLPALPTHDASGQTAVRDAARGPTECKRSASRTRAGPAPGDARECQARPARCMHTRGPRKAAGITGMQSHQVLDVGVGMPAEQGLDTGGPVVPSSVV